MTTGVKEIPRGKHGVLSLASRSAATTCGGYSCEHLMIENDSHCESIPIRTFMAFAAAAKITLTSMQVENHYHA